jgi:hypothetical protein
VTVNMDGESRRNTLQNRLADAYREADKLIVTVSSGVLALSVAFLGRVDKPAEIWLLRFAWIALLVAVAFVLCSILMEQADKRRRIQQLDNDEDETNAKTDAFTNLLNIGGFTSFLLGLIALAAFLCVNTN